MPQSRNGLPGAVSLPRAPPPGGGVRRLTDVASSRISATAGGLNADTLSDGTISVGDRLLPDFPAERARLRAVKLPACLSRGLSVPRGRIFRKIGRAHV